MYKFNLQHFAAGDVVNTTAGITNANTGAHTPNNGEGGLSGEMRTCYSDYLIDRAEPKLVHDQFGQKCPIPKNGGKSIEFRKYDPLPTLTTEMEEGVTPKGQSLKVSTVKSEVKQYGEVYDNLELTEEENPFFINPTRGDYRMREDADFFHIPFEEMGRY